MLGNYTEFRAQGGGRIKLGPHLTGDKAALTVQGADSVIDTSLVTAMQARIFVAVSDGAQFGFANPVDGVEFRAIEVQGAASRVDVSAITELRGAWLAVLEGAKLSMPQLRAYDDDGRDARLWAIGQGSHLDLSALQEFRADSSYGSTAKTIVLAQDGGRIDIGGKLTGQAEYIVDGATSAFGFETVTEVGGGWFEFVARNGGRVDVPSGQDFRPTLLRLSAESGGVIRAPALENFEVDFGATGVASDAGSIVDLSPIQEITGGIGIEARNGGRVILGGRIDAIGMIADGADSQIDVAAISEVHSFGNAAAYNGARIVFPRTSADFRLNSVLVSGQGSHVDLGNVNRFYDTRIAAFGGGLIVVPDTIDMTNPFLIRFGASYLQSRIDLTAIERLQSRFPTNPQITFAVDDGVIEANDLVNVRIGFHYVGGGRITADDVTAYFLSMPKNEAGRTAELQLSGSLRLVSASPEATNMVGGTLTFSGGGLQSLELGGRDYSDGDDGYTAAQNRDGTFGIARLLVGREEHPTRLNLVDVLNNGSHIGDNREALYIFDYADGLNISSGSVLHLRSIFGTMHAYTRIDGEYVELNSLIPGPNSTIPFDQGFISNVLLGDFDLDGDVTAADLELLLTAVREGSADEGFDLNLSGTVDSVDFQELLADVLFTVDGDGNLDGNVDLLDLNVIRNNFGAAGDWAAGDFDGDGLIGLADR